MRLITVGKSVTHVKGRELEDSNCLFGKTNIFFWNSVIIIYTFTSTLHLGSRNSDRRMEEHEHFTFTFLLEKK
jgi:hypothetical protein